MAVVRIIPATGLGSARGYVCLALKLTGAFLTGFNP